MKLHPGNCGWFLENNYLKPAGYVGDQTRLKINDLLEMTENENNEELWMPVYYKTCNETDMK